MTIMMLMITMIMIRQAAAESTVWSSRYDNDDVNDNNDNDQVGSGGINCMEKQIILEEHNKARQLLANGKVSKLEYVLFHAAAFENCK